MTVDNHVSVLAMSSPARRNAISPKMLQDIRAAIDDAKNNDEIRLIVLKGADGGPFSSGYDISSLLASGGQDAPAERERMRDTAERELEATVEAIWDSTVPVMACVEQYSIGASLELVAAADIRVCDAQSTFTLPALKVGTAYSSRGLQRLAGAFSGAAVAELIWNPSRITARRACELGIVHKVVTGPISDEVQVRVSHLMKSSSDVVANLKANIRGRRR